jgi:hypothetical protein
MVSAASREALLVTDLTHEHVADVRTRFRFMQDRRAR